MGTQVSAAVRGSSHPWRLLLVMCGLLFANGKAPAGEIEFLDQPISANTFVFCIDTSCSMGWGSPTPIQVVRDAFDSAIHQLGPEDRFSVVTFGNAPSVWSLAAVPATVQSRAAASAWLQNIQVSGASCPTAAMTLALEVAGTGVGFKGVVLTLDGDPHCLPPSLSAGVIAAANPGIPIYLFHGGAYGATLALQSGGVDFLDPTGPPALSVYRRGDVTDDGSVDVVDVVALLSIVFGTTVVGCPDSADIDDNGVINLADPISLLRYLFAAGAPPPLPGPEGCGTVLRGPLGACYAACP